LDLDWNGKTGLTIQIQNPILPLDCQSQSNPPNWIAIRIEQSSNPIQQYPAAMHTANTRWGAHLVRVRLSFSKEHWWHHNSLKTFLNPFQHTKFWFFSPPNIHITIHGQQKLQPYLWVVTTQDQLQFRPLGLIIYLVSILSTFYALVFHTKVLFSIDV